MKNLELAQKIEKYNISIPDDWKTSLNELDSCIDIPDFTDAIIHGLELLILTGRKPLTAGHMVALFIATICKAMKSEYSKFDVLSIYEITPEYLAILISNISIRHYSIKSYNEELTDLVKRYVNR